MKTPSLPHPAHPVQPLPRSWLRMVPTAAALLLAIVLFFLQQIYFEIGEKNDDATGQAASLIGLGHAMRGLDDDEIHAALGEAASRFENVLSIQYCHDGNCVGVMAPEGEPASCKTRSSWRVMCVSVPSPDDPTETVVLGYSLDDIYIEAVRNDALMVIILAIASAVTWVGSRKLRQRVRSAEQLLRHAATHDALTGLPNRAEFEERVSRFIAGHQAGALLFLDLDGFKEINDHYGHHVGDRMLCAVADRIRAALAVFEEVGRLGGDEFGVLVPCRGEAPRAEDTAAALIRCLSIPFAIDGRTMSIGASIGCAVLDRELDDFDEALRRADVALYEVKRSGRGRMLHFDPAMDVVARTRFELQSELKIAIESDQLFLEYQPQVSSNGELRGAEALVRWRHPARGLIRPDQFIGIAEESGLICALGLLVAETACADLVKARQRGLQLPYVAINVSAHQLDDENLVATLCEIVQRHGLTAQDLELEITESSLMKSSTAEDAIRRFASAGFRIAIDDFGTGYSSLSRLQSMPVDKLKIDRSFINQVFNVEHGEVIAEMIIAMAQRMRLRTVAEGVETHEQAAWLRAAGCSLMQGYLFARPMPFEQLVEWTGAVKPEPQSA